MDPEFLSINTVLKMTPLTVNGHLVDSDDEKAQNASDTDYIVIRARRTLTHAQKLELERIGVAIQEPLDENVFLCHYRPIDLGAIREKSYIQYADAYHPHFKVHAQRQQNDPELRLRGPGDSEVRVAAIAPEAALEKIPLSLGLHKNLSESPEQIVDRLCESGVVSRDETRSHPNRIDTLALPRDVPKLARVDGVRVIERTHDIADRNDIARGLLGVPARVGEVATDANGRTTVINEVEYDGAGQTIAVHDTGFDKGSKTDVHPAFVAGRVVRLYDGATPDPAADKAADLRGHGTHVTGSILGEGKYAGTAPGALLISSNINGTNSTWPKGSLTPLFQGPYGDGARVFNESWGKDFTGKQEAYDLNATDIDDFAWSHPETLFCWAAGNDGDHPRAAAQIESEAAAKNVLTVGVCLSTRPADDKGVALADPDAPDSNHYLISPMTSSGPTFEGRIKPDVIAPGDIILSACSRMLATTPDRRGVSPDPQYYFAAGSSMACALISGCAAVLRQALMARDPRKPPPSAALMKALIINGAAPLRQYVKPNPDSGFGRVSLTGSARHLTEPPERAGLVENTIKDRDRPKTVTVTVPKRDKSILTGDVLGKRLKATLVWNEPSGAALFNQLRLVVFDSKGDKRNGNCGADQNLTDDVNNVQQVDWDDVAEGDVKVQVHCIRTTTANAVVPYALVWILI